MARQPLHDGVEARVAGLPIWSGPVVPKPLSGGLTNRNFVVDDAGRKVVVRVCEDNAVHGVSRAAELAASQAAHAAGLSPAVVHWQPGILAVEFIDGRTFTTEDVRNPANLDRLVDLVRRCHRDIPRHLRGPAAMFWVFHVVRDYAHTLRAAGSRYVPTLDGLAHRAEALEAAVGAIDVVFGHNDLLAANIIDDGNRLWLIDWEYAGFNSALFDLGGLVSNSEMPEPLAEELYAAYLGRPMDADLRRRAAAMTAASLLREAMWSMVSELAPPSAAFDYAAYTADNLARFEAAYRRFDETCTG
jgi:thiamine kinase-like enzyme